METNETISEKLLCRLLGAVIEMRMYQRTYFAYRLESDKKKAIRAEQRIDRMIIQLKAQGYKPIIDVDDRPKLF